MDKDIKDRTFNFSLSIIDICQQLPETGVSIVLCKQVLRSGTSIGANVEEATAAASKNDFVHKMNIALKEARETHYWLRLMEASKIIDKNQFLLVGEESNQIKRVLGSIVSKMRGKSKL